MTLARAHNRDTVPLTCSSPEPVVSWSRGRETRGSDTGRLQIKPSGCGDENVPLTINSVNKLRQWNLRENFLLTLFSSIQVDIYNNNNVKLLNTVKKDVINNVK